MTKKIASDVRVYFGSYDLGTATTSISIALEAKALDPTALTDTAERALAGMRGDAVTWAGLFDDATSADAAGSALIATGTAVLSVLVGTGTGNRAYVGTVYLLAAKPASNIGDLVKEELMLKPDSNWGIGKVTQAKRWGTTTWTSSTIDDGAVSTAGGDMYLHMFTYSSGSTLTINLDHSTDGTSWTVATSATLTTIGSRKLSFAGTLNRYIRFGVSTLGTGAFGTVEIAQVYVRN